MGTPHTGCSHPWAGTAQALPTQPLRKPFRPLTTSARTQVNPLSRLNTWINQMEEPIHVVRCYLNPRIHCVSALVFTWTLVKPTLGLNLLTGVALLRRQLCWDKAHACCCKRDVNSLHLSTENDIAVLSQLNWNVFDKITNAWQSTFELCRGRKRRGNPLYKQQNNTALSNLSNLLLLVCVCVCFTDKIK